MAVDQWNGNGDWSLNPTDWSQSGPPNSSTDAEIQSGGVSLSTSGAAYWLLVDNGAAVSFADSATLSVTSFLQNAGAVNVTGNGDHVAVAGRLTNTGAITIGAANLTATTAVTAAALQNSGSIVVQGVATGATQASLKIAGAATATLTGSVRVSGDGLMQFGSGSIASISVGATMELDGAAAKITTGGATTSALANLASNSGALILQGGSGYGAGGVTFKTSTGFVNNGAFSVDSSSGDGGSVVTLGGALTNHGSADIGAIDLSAATTVHATGLVNSGSLVVQGNASAGSSLEALLSITGAAASTLTGAVRVSGDAVIAYASGEITAIQNGSSLELDGAKAAITTNSGASSALAQLATNNGQLQLLGASGYGAGGAQLATTTGFINNGVFSMDAGNQQGGSKASFGGLFANYATVNIGNSSLSASTTVVATGLNNTGGLTLQGAIASNATQRALLDITGAASSTLTGTVRVSGDAEILYASGGVTTILIGSSLELDGAKASVASGANSALTGLVANNGALTLQGDSGYGAGGALLRTTTNFTNNGVFSVDSANLDGASVVKFGGVFANHGTTTIGNVALAASTTVTATGLNNSGALVLQGATANGATQQALLDVTGATAAALTGQVRVSGDAVLEFASGEITAILSGSSLELDGAGARIETSGGTASALAHLASNNGELLLQGAGGNGAGGAAFSTTGSFTNNGEFWIDPYNYDSGSGASFGGALVNNNSIDIGETNLSANTTVTATTLVNNAALTVQGNYASAATQQATLDITGAAAAALTGNVRVGGDGLIEFGSGEITSIAAGSALELDGAGARILTGNGASSALAKLTVNYGAFVLQGDTGNGAGGAKLAMQGFTNDGSLSIDAANNDGGSAVTFNGIWTNNGVVVIGQSYLATSTTIKCTNIVNNGALTLQGNSSIGSTIQASIIAYGAAPSAITGTMRVSGDALLEFASGLITSISGSSSLELDGAEARITTGGATASALSHLAVNDDSLTLRGNSAYGLGGAALTTTVAFVNNGTLSVDAETNDGASAATFGGLLTNNETIDIGNTSLSSSTTVLATGLVNNGSLTIQGNVSYGSTDQATMKIAGAAAAAVQGPTRIGGDALLEFGSGAVTSIAGGSSLELDGAEARITSGSATASALTTLSENEGSFQLQGNSSNGAGGAIWATTTGFVNDGTFSVDVGGSDGASSATIAGVLTNDMTLNIGNVNLSAVTTVKAAGLTNNGALVLQGNISDGSPDLATLVIAGAAPTVAQGTMRISGDAVLEFGSGLITTITGGGDLELDGAGARITRGNATSSALTTLATNYGVLALQGNSSFGGGGAVLTTSTGFTNGGQLLIDNGAGDGGSTATFGGTLTNDAAVTIGQGDLSATTTVDVKGLVNNGSLTLQGNVSGGGTDQAILDDAGAAGTVTNGPIRVGGDALLEFGSGGLTTISNAGYLELDGANARITTGGTTVSALATLTTNDGSLVLVGNSYEGAGGATVTTTAAFANYGTVLVDFGGGYGGSQATFGGALTNYGSMMIGNTALSGLTTVTAAALVNANGLSLFGSNGAESQLVIHGAASNTGNLDINVDSELDVTGANAFTQSAGLTTVYGTLAASTINANGGLVEFYSAIGAGDGISAMNIGADGTLEFGSGVDSSHSVAFTGATGDLALDDLVSFAGSISKFAGNDVIDLINGAATSFHYAGSATAGTLTLTGSGGTLGTLAFTGDYTGANFQLTGDGHGGVDVRYI